MNIDRLQRIVGRFPECRIAVLGDFFLDKYLDTDPELAEISVETGKTAHQVVGVRRSPGAAGTIVNNLAALAAGELHALGITGDDGEGFELRQCSARSRLPDGRPRHPPRTVHSYLPEAERQPYGRPFRRIRAL